jgi:hypothetical protein
MECSSVQEKLSVYVEGMISPEERKLIDEHISSCSKCKEALYDLKKTIDYVHNLEDVEPPAWLTQKVMARIQSETKPKKRILQKLFYPLYIKLPVEAVAVVLVAVTAIYIFKIIQPEIGPQKVPSEVATQIPPHEKEKTPAVVESKEKVIPPFPPLEKGGKGGFEAEQAMPAKKPDTIDKSAETPKAPTQVLREAEVPSETRPSAGAVAKDESRIEVLSRAPEAKSLTETKEEIIGFTIHVKDVEIAIKEIEESLIQHGAKIVKIEHLDNKDTVTAKIESQKLRQLLTEFKYIGEVEEKTTTFKTNQGIIEILIEIVRM